jgi:hypothetical protein
MNRNTVRKSISVLVALVLCSCFPSWCRPSGIQLPDDYEIEDVRVLPQDMRTYASSRSGEFIAPSCRESFLADFMLKQYAPWRENVPQSDIADAVRTMRNHAQWPWYGENRRKVPSGRLRELLANCDLEHLPSMNRPAIALFPAAMRVLPSTAPFLKKADDYPFDVLQNASVKMNDSLRVLHVSADGLWVFVKGADASGWVESRDVGYISEAQAGEWMQKELLVVVRDATLLRDANGGAIAKVELGTLFPRVGEDENYYTVSVPSPSDGHGMRVINARIPKDAARRFPLELNRETVAMVGNQLLGKPYGWGGLYHNRDCSSMIREFFLPFGIWLPRGSYNQIHSGNPVSLAGLTNKEKERVLREKGVPFLTLVYLRGHIMLYVGNINGRPLVFHASWGVSLKDGEGGVSKHVIGKSIVSTLTPGSELNLASGTLLDKVRSMLVLGDCPVSLGQASKEERR